MAFCIGAPGVPYVGASTTPSAPSTTSTPVAIPSNIAANTTTDCGAYYEATLGDDCNKILMKYGITLSDFIFLNPSININCTNLYADESYCVKAMGDSM